MKLCVVAVGHRMPEWIAAGYNEYARRMPRETRIELIEIKPEPRTTGKTTVQIKEAEAQRILGAIPHNALCVALDERGANWTTRQLSERMRQWMNEGWDVAFIIGGADGLHDSVKNRADQLLALSAMTMPHAMVRVLLAEQIYRAYSLLHNHPYHRE